MIFTGRFLNESIGMEACRLLCPGTDGRVILLARRRDDLLKASRLFGLLSY